MWARRENLAAAISAGAAVTAIAIALLNPGSVHVVAASTIAVLVAAAVLS